MSKLRVIIPVAVMVAIGVGFAFNSGIGTLSAIGWKDISLLCPLGALGTMIASKTFIPQAVISLVIAAAAILLLGRAFCAWVCPVPIVGKLREVFKKPAKKQVEASSTEAETADGAANRGDAIAQEETAVAKAGSPLTASEKRALKSGCNACKSMRSSQPATFDSRHFVLGGALLSAAVFGFPVFCLICPIGLTFATIMLVMLLFSGGDVTWSLIAVPALLVIEVLLLRKWCANFCPLSALMSLVAKGNRTFKPAINDEVCLETAKGAHCDLCGSACEVGIDVRHPERGAAWSECTKCRACVDVCPTQAITMPFLPKRTEKAVPTVALEEEIETAR